MREGNFCFLFDLSFVGARAARLHWFLENLLKNQEVVLRNRVLFGVFDAADKIDIIFSNRSQTAFTENSAPSVISVIGAD